jgi:hypothetical protein
MLDLGVILALDRGIRIRKRAVFWTLGCLWIVLIFVLLVAVARSGQAIAPITIVFGTMLSLTGGLALRMDETIYRARVRSARARQIPSFGRMVWAWVVMMVVLELVLAAIGVLAVL